MFQFSRSRAAEARAFTLVELLVVIAIIGVLVALLAAGDSGGPRGGSAIAVHQQHEATGTGRPQFRVGSRRSCRPAASAIRPAARRPPT